MEKRSYTAHETHGQTQLGEVWSREHELTETESRERYQFRGKGTQERLALTASTPEDGLNHGDHRRQCLLDLGIFSLDCLFQAQSALQLLIRSLRLEFLNTPLILLALGLLSFPDSSLSITICSHEKKS